LAHNRAAIAVTACSAAPRTSAAAVASVDGFAARLVFRDRVAAARAAVLRVASVRRAPAPFARARVLRAAAFLVLREDARVDLLVAERFDEAFVARTRGAVDARLEARFLAVRFFVTVPSLYASSCPDSAIRVLFSSNSMARRTRAP
jgi:hypothetical protein